MQKALNFKFDIRSQGRLRDNVSPPHPDPFSCSKMDRLICFQWRRNCAGKIRQIDSKSNTSHRKIWRCIIEVQQCLACCWVETYPESIFLCLGGILPLPGAGFGWLLAWHKKSIWCSYQTGCYTINIPTKPGCNTWERGRLKGCKAESWKVERWEHGNVVEIERLLLQMSGDARDTQSSKPARHDDFLSFSHALKISSQVYNYETLGTNAVLNCNDLQWRLEVFVLSLCCPAHRQITSSGFGIEPDILPSQRLLAGSLFCLFWLPTRRCKRAFHVL